jgi:NDP-sugar pyrophosphorylase family protein
MTTTILIPLAGSGQRFRDAGCGVAKPLIEVAGVPMIRRAVDSILHGWKEGHDCRLVFVVRDAHAENVPLTNYLWHSWPGCRIVNTPKPTEGAACTCLLARWLIDNDEPLLIANCDQVVDGGIQPLLETDADAAVLTMPGDGTKKWSYALVDPPGEVAKVREKEPISDRATVGIYWWRRGRNFCESVERMIFRDDQVNGEFYVAPTLDYLIRDGLFVREVRVEDYGGVFHAMGTPEDATEYEKFLANQ